MRDAVVSFQVEDSGKVRPRIISINKQWSDKLFNRINMSATRATNSDSIIHKRSKVTQISCLTPTLINPIVDRFNITQSVYVIQKANSLAWLQ